jgi:hypothetical protein
LKSCRANSVFEKNVEGVTVAQKAYGITLRHVPPGVLPAPRGLEEDGCVWWCP